MNLPTTAQVLAATRHVASFAAGAIAILGLSTKINPDQAAAIINSLGTLVSDAVVVIGLVTPVLAAWLASRSASPAAQIRAVDAMPDVAKIIPTTDAAPDSAIVAAAADPTQPKVVANPQEKK